MKILGPIITSRTIGASYLQLNDAIDYAFKNNFKKIILNEPHPKSWMRFILLCKKYDIQPIILLKDGIKSYLIKDSESMVEAIKSYNKKESPDLKTLKMNIDNIIYPHRIMKEIINKKGLCLSDSSELSKKLKYFHSINTNYDLKTFNLNFPNLGGIDNLKKIIKKIEISLNEKLRLSQEFDVIEKMNVSNYILNVKKIVDIANENNILVGPGRGSAVGSLVVNKLGITKINPLDFNLYFERFLNINRKQLPDIDLDIESTRRNELIEKLRDFYGDFNVSFIRTLSTMKYKSSVKKTKELLKYDTDIMLDNPIRSHKNFKKFKNASKKDNIFFRIAYFFEGMEQAESTHAAGVIITDKSQLNYLPLEKKEIPIIEWTMEDLTYLNIEKFDILSLDTLSFLKKLDYVENFEKHIDEKVLKTFSKGLTKGIFQLDSYSGKNIIKKIKPKNFEEISISIALNRPGPLESGMVEDYVTSHSDNYLKKLLPETKGVIVYQEQIMYLAQKLGNLNFEESDILRRTLSKKNSNAIMKLKNKFMINATKKIGEKKAKEMFEKIENFSQYSFNKSHSIAYSFILKWLLEEKFLTPAKFFYNYILHKGLDTEVINECNFLGIKILNPDIEFPQGNFDEKEIMLPMSFISGVSNKIILSFQNIKFKTIDDFFHFVYNNNFSRNLVEQIIKSGALDKIDKNRRNLLRKMTEYKKGQLPEIEDLKSSVFGEKSEKHKEVETNEEMIIEYEFESIKYPLSIINNEKLSTSLIKKYFDYYENISFDGYAYKNYLFDNSAIIKNKYFYKKPKKIIKEI
jgi:DNA polymerase-3 subunit alpha